MTHTIHMARQFLEAGNTGAYARLISSDIRSASSTRKIAVLRAAIAADRAEGLFHNLNTDCPTAA